MDTSRGKKRKICTTNKSAGDFGDFGDFGELGGLNGFSLSSMTFERKEEPKSEPTFTAAQVEVMLKMFVRVIKEDGTKESKSNPEPPSYIM